MKRAIVISHNWKTHETLSSEFTGNGSADKAAGWANRKSFLWKDFPETDGWEHFSHWNKEAGEERGERIAHELCGHGSITEIIPQ